MDEYGRRPEIDGDAGVLPVGELVIVLAVGIALF
jgi:hypothetical protein